MKITKIIAFLFLIIACSFSIASAQLQVSLMHRGVITRLYETDTTHILSSESERFVELGEYSASVDMLAGDGVLTSSQNTLVTNENYSQASLSGHFGVSITQPAMDFPHGMDSSAEVEILYSSPFTCDYSLSGVVSGPGQGILQIIDWNTWEVVSTESWTGTSLTASGQLPPGSFVFHFELLDYVFGEESVSRYSECDFEIFIAPQLPVATEDLSFGAVKALFR